MNEPAQIEGPHRKLRRAEQLIRSIELAIEAFAKTDWCAVNLSRNLDGSYDLRFEFHSIPNDVGAEVGDAIHNMRSSLDLLAVALVARAGGNVKGVSFPFSASAVDLDKAIVNSKFHRASHRDKMVLRSLRPFKGGNVLLRAVHDLDLQDKHRALIPVVNSVSTPGVRVRSEQTMPPFGDLIAELDPTDPPKLRVSFPLDSALAGEEIVPALWKMHETVVSAVAAFLAGK